MLTFIAVLCIMNYLLLYLEENKLSKLNEKCTVAQRNVSLEDISKMLEEQGNIYTPNERKGKEDAFSKTLRGSKIYLKEQGLMENAGD